MQGGVMAFLERVHSSRSNVLRPVILHCSVLSQGICFIRSSRPENAVIYNSNEDFQVGRGQVSAVHASVRPCEASPE